jgi:glyoxylase-like metal-dependent hydrolase (beta-lactamase superfamily II)
MPSWDGFRIVPPHIEFADTLSLPGGVQLHHVGGRHAEDSTVVAVPDSGVVLLGDCFYPPPLHLRAPGDGVDVRLVRAPVQTYGGYDWFVDSHDHPHSREEIRELLAALSP